MTDDRSIYERWDVPRVVNAAGTKTRIGGSLIRPEAADAMRAAAAEFVRLSDLQAAASELIADATGAEAGYVTAGASAGMTLAAAACIAGSDPAVASRLPRTEGVADEIVIPRTHRTGYDHAYAVAGARIVDVGTNDRHLGTGATGTEPWELDRAITDATAAVGYVQKPFTEPPLETVVEVAHDNDVPVIVDAAAELPPASNLERFVDAGADLVVFSGGKAVRGPQTTGIVAGRRELVGSIALQQLDAHAAADVWDPPAALIDSDAVEGVPRQGVGRGMKVGKEELVGLLRALELFLAEDTDAQRAAWRARADRIAAALGDEPGLSTRVAAGDKTAVAPAVVVGVDPAASGRSATGIVRSLRAENPRVFVGADRVDDGEFTVDPMCLTDEEGEYVVERIRSHLRDGDDPAETGDTADTGGRE